MYYCFLIHCSPLCLDKSRFGERKNIFYFTPCSFSYHFVFWLRWITEQANTVILMPWRDSRGKKSHLPKEPVSAVNPPPLPEWAACFKKHSLSYCFAKCFFYQNLRLSFLSLHSSARKKISGELDLTSLNNISKIIF